jgi:hypothetical protein
MSYFELYEKRKKAKSSLMPNSKWISKNECFISPFIENELITIEFVKDNEVYYLYEFNKMSSNRPIETFIRYCTPVI